MKRAQVLRAAWTAALLTLLAVVACTDDLAPRGEVYAVGVVEGRVLVAGAPDTARIEADRVGDDDGPDILRYTRADTQGRYRFELPAGDYRVRLSGQVDGHYHNAVIETLTVPPGVLRHDIVCGRVELRLQVPVELQDQDLPFQVKAKGETLYGAILRPPADGHVTVTFAFVPAGTYRVYWNGPDSCFLPGTVDPAAADTLAVDVSETAIYEADLDGMFAVLSGRMTGAWQVAGLQPPYIQLYEDAGYSSSRRCEEDGSWVYPFTRARTVRIAVDGDGETRRWYGGDSFETATRVDVVPGARIGGIDLVDSGLRLRLDGPGDIVVPGVAFTVRYEDGSEQASRGFGANPRVIANLAPGRARVRVGGHCEGWNVAEQWYDGATSPADATPVDLVAGEVRDLTLTLQPGGRIRGEMLEADGSPAEDFRLSLHDAARQPLCDSGWWFADGVFEFVGLGSGEYYLAANRYWSQVWWYPGTFDPAAAISISVVAPDGVVDLSWSLPRMSEKRGP